MNTRKLTLFGTTALLMAGFSKFIKIKNTESGKGGLRYASSCKHENAESFNLNNTTGIGVLESEKISGFDKKTNKLFVANTTGGKNQIDVIDFSDPSGPIPIAHIDLAPCGGVVNSIAALDGMVAVAISEIPWTNAGKLMILSAIDYTEVKVIPVAAVPTEVKYSPNGKIIITAFNGQCGTDYVSDASSAISIISIKDNYAMYTLDTSSFALHEVQVSKRAHKVEPDAAEPGVITISPDSRIAWVTMQPDNSIAKVDLRNKVIEEIFPAGFKNCNMTINSLLPGDRTLGTISFNNWPAYGV